MRNQRRSSSLLVTAVLAACGSEIPARIETVDGHRIEIATAGAGDTTVVFEAGLGGDLTAWDGVANDVASHARVFSYSRPGYGASDPAWTPRDPKQIVEELRGLLVSQGYAPPYLVVGHSNGGGYMELFAKSHPDEVTGVVLVDPRHRDFLRACETAELDLCGIPDDVLVDQAPVVIAEYRAYDLASAQMQSAGGFGAYPVRVLTADDQAGSAERDLLWTSMHAELAAEAVNGAQIIVPHSTHDMQRDRPDVIIETILALLPEVTP